MRTAILSNTASGGVDPGSSRGGSAIGISDDGATGAGGGGGATGASGGGAAGTTGAGGGGGGVT